MPEGNGVAMKRKIHPGSGRRKAPTEPRGRVLEPEAQEEVASLLGQRPRRADLLIEYLHLLQDTHGCLQARHLQALGDELSLPMAAVYEVASFYAHFDIVLDGETPPPPLTVRVCDSLTCELFGAAELLNNLPDALADAGLGDAVRVVRAPCMGRCDTAPTCEVGHRHVDAATPERVVQAAEGAYRRSERHPIAASYEDLQAYRSGGGYRLLDDCRNGSRSAKEITDLLANSNLRGLGGAGFPAGQKWRLVAQQPKPRLLAVNADEGEPGTFKDRYYLERWPHRFLEGMLIAAWAVEAERLFIYLRDEYPAIQLILERELAELRKAGVLNGITVELRRGAGAYICGEESAMLESLEGRRGYPRHKPPYPSQVGLFGRPTLTHNVETLYWVREIVERGAGWFASQGRNGRKGLRSFSVSGRVKTPGMKLAPAGITVRDLIQEYCGGMSDGHRFKGYLPGGASGGILPAHLDHIPLDFGTLEEFGCFIGSAAVVVLSDQDNIRQAALNLMRFFEDESCGQCTPCRVGTEKTVKLMQDPVWDIALLSELAETMRDASICGLGQAAPNPLLSVLRYFPEDLQA
ncbi:NADH-ubiquinone oxidoreductase-F iron-sulfur binding region domain-containing protein [Algihabitans albus]|uniref:NADH-ubiquinone oxidoreductase-F iron-sulfur binding region domain-containing protein n=1 Tax=Algihabitans albus TaxID=2164067 RepID=UPI000E5C8A36|nr:NADH-ubiquinone oxidoreductase-F iron-sulfur binding region domain-containing protein [Algihabitans albus]